MILPTGNRTKTRPGAAGFTLIELILVMAILIVVLSMSATSLSSFFGGRTLDSEGRRFLALTRHAQNRAVSEGVPMSLWIDEDKKRYGLEMAPGFQEADDKTKDYELNRDLTIEIQWLNQGAIRPLANETILQFTPEGHIAETNPELITIKDKTGAAVYIAPDRNRLNYEITTNNVFLLRR